MLLSTKIPQMQLAKLLLLAILLTCCFSGLVSAANDETLSERLYFGLEDLQNTPVSWKGELQIVYPDGGVVFYKKGKIGKEINCERIKINFRMAPQTAYKVDLQINGARIETLILLTQHQ